ncbi:MAG: ABC transporter permease [Pseudomonadota bacterium]
MTWLRLAIANLRLSPLTSAVNMLLMALGTASIVLLMLAGSQLSETMTRDAGGIDLVLGSTGSPVQLVLSAVYHADLPPGNISLEDAEQWADDPRVRTAIPLSLGDSYRGHRIVGTTPEYAELYGAGLASGRFWNETLEAVVGSAAAQSAGLSPGASFEGSHGLESGGQRHDSHPYRVVGVLEPTGTVVDRLILTSLESVWDLHGAGDDDHDDEHGHDDDDDEHGHDDDDDEHGHDDDDDEHGHDGDGHEDDDHADDAHDHEDEPEHDSGHDRHDSSAEITAMLLTYQSPMAALTLPRQVNAEGKLQAAAPAIEIARILQLVGIGLDGLSAFAWVLILTAALSVFAALYGSLRARRSDLAILRCLGATRGELLLALILEGLLLSLVGVVLGFLVAHGAMELLGGWLESTRGVVLTGWTWIPEETLLLFSLFGVGAIAAAIPAVQAYRTDVARVLAEA